MSYSGYTKARARANDKYNKKAYDVMAVRMKKGMREDYKTAAEERGLSLAAFVVASMDEYIQRHPVIRE